MKQLMCFLFVSLLAGLWLSLEEAQCLKLNEGGHTMSSFTTFITNINHRVRKPFKNASRWCNSTVPGSSLIIINNIESQTTVNIFIGRRVLANETFVMDAQNISASVSLELSSVNDHPAVPTDSGTSEFQNDPCKEPKHGRSLAYCVGHVNPQYRYICKDSGAAINRTNGDVAQPVQNSYKQCICISPQCNRKSNLGWVEYDRKWWSCDCSQGYDIVCQKVEEESDAVTTKIHYPEEKLASTSADFKSTPSIPDNTISRLQRTTVDTASIPSMNKEPSNPESDEQETEQTNSFDTTQICLILLLFVAVVSIAVAVILIIRKRKYARRHEVSPLKKTDQNESVSPTYEPMVPDNRPSCGNAPIYTELEMTQQPTPSNSTTYASIQPTSEVVDMGKSVDYVDLDLPKKDQQKPKSADKETVSVSPIYSQPFESPTSDNNTDYVEPYKPDKAPTATAPVLSHHAAADQQNVYSLATAIPSGDPNAIYSEPN